MSEGSYERWHFIAGCYADEVHTCGYSGCAARLLSMTVAGLVLSARVIQSSCSDATQRKEAMWPNTHSWRAVRGRAWTEIRRAWSWVLSQRRARTHQSCAAVPSVLVVALLTRTSVSPSSRSSSSWCLWLCRWLPGPPVVGFGFALVLIVVFVFFDCLRVPRLWRFRRFCRGLVFWPFSRHFRVAGCPPGGEICGI